MSSRLNFIHSQNYYFTSPVISSSVPPVVGAGLKYLTPDLMSLPKPDQIEVEADGSEDEKQTGWKH